MSARKQRKERYREQVKRESMQAYLKLRTLNQLGLENTPGFSPS